MFKIFPNSWRGDTITITETIVVTGQESLSSDNVSQSNPTALDSTGTRLSSYGKNIVTTWLETDDQITNAPIINATNEDSWKIFGPLHFLKHQFTTNIFSAIGQYS